MNLLFLMMWGVTSHGMSPPHAPAGQAQRVAAVVQRDVGPQQRTFVRNRATVFGDQLTGAGARFVYVDDAVVLAAQFLHGPVEGIKRALDPVSARNARSVTVFAQVNRPLVVPLSPGETFNVLTVSGGPRAHSFSSRSYIRLRKLVVVSP